LQAFREEITRCLDKKLGSKGINKRGCQKEMIKTIDRFE
jgi:hypothetical protein